MLHLVHAKALYKRETYRALHRVDYDDCAEHKIKKPEVSQHVDARYAQNSGFLLRRKYRIAVFPESRQKHLAKRRSWVSAMCA